MSESIHRNHRKRMRERFWKQGLEGMLDHETLEMLLYFAMPRVDTNPIAHRLIHTFGSLHGALDASPSQLKEVQGMGENSVLLLSFLHELIRRYALDKNEQETKGIRLIDDETIGQYVVPYFLGMKEECMIVFAIDGKGRVMGVKEVSRGSVRTTEVNMRKIVEFALHSCAADLIIAHNHPGGLALPSHDDMQTTRRIRDTLLPLSIGLRDHIIVAGDDFVSMRDSKLMQYLDP